MNTKTNHLAIITGTILVLICTSLSCYSQVQLDLKGTVVKKISSDLMPGTEVYLIAINESEENSAFHDAILVKDGIEQVIDVKDLDKINFIPLNIRDFWQQQALITGVYENITNNGMRYDIRQELEDETLEALEYFENNNMFFSDSYLESYLYSIALKVCPIRLED